MKYLNSFKLFENVKTFDFEVEHNYNHKSKYKNSKYIFTTDNGLEYAVSIGDVIRGGKYLGTRIVEFAFKLRTGDPNTAMSVLTNNTSEVFKVMNTIFTCIKDFTDTYFVQHICYLPTETEGKSGSSDSRARLYNHYFKKYYPNCEIEKIKDQYFVTLN